MGANLAETWEDAEREFPAAERYGIQVQRHDAGFYNGQIDRVYGGERDAGGQWRMISYCQGADANAALVAAVEAARKAEAAGRDWMHHPLPGAKAKSTTAAELTKLAELDAEIL